MFGVLLESDSQLSVRMIVKVPRNSVSANFGLVKWTDRKQEI